MPGKGPPGIQSTDPALSRELHHLGNIVVSLAIVALALFVATLLVAPAWLDALLHAYRWIGAGLALAVAAFFALFGAAAVWNLHKGD